MCCTWSSLTMQFAKWVLKRITSPGVRPVAWRLSRRADGKAWVGMRHHLSENSELFKDSFGHSREETPTEHGWTKGQGARSFLSWLARSPVPRYLPPGTRLSCNAQPVRIHASWRGLYKRDLVGKRRRSCLVLGFIDGGTSHWGLWEGAGSSPRTRITPCWRDANKVLRKFFSQANTLQHVGPFPTLSRVAVFQVLSKVIGPEKFLGLVAFAELVYVGEVVNPAIPIRLG